MGYHRVAEADPTPERPSVGRSVSDAAGLENVAVNRYGVRVADPSVGRPERPRRADGHGPDT